MKLSNDYEKQLKEVWLNAWMMIDGKRADRTYFADACLEDFKRRFPNEETEDN